MKFIKYTYLFWVVSLFIACTPQNKENQQKDMNHNPLVETWDTPFEVPPFDRIKSKDYLPAINTAIAIHQKEIETIISNKEKASFSNTIEALENSGKLLSKIRKLFYAVNAANTDSVLKQTAKKVAPLLSNHRDNINLNSNLFRRVKEVYNSKDSLHLTIEQKKLLDETFKRFVRAGANVKESNKERLREINARLSVLTQEFGDHLLNETNAFELYVTDKNDLGSLSDGVLATAAAEAKKRGHNTGWSFTLQRSSINSFLKASPNRNLRKKIFDAYAMRANNANENDNNAIIKEIVALRLEKANMLGYKTHASYVLSDAMAKDSKTVFNFLDQLWTPALEMAKKERTALSKKMKKEGINTPFKAWDWRYYVEKVRKERYDYNADETRPYFEINAVVNGAFVLANKLFGLQFKERKDLPTWHKDQRVYEVLEKNGAHRGILYMDMFSRESKRGGAWMNSIRAQSKEHGNMIYPIVTTNFNYPPPADGRPALLTFSEAQTVFHEFGHALHGLLSEVTYASLSGTNVPRDYVEFPSQVMENWMSEPDMLKLYAKHYKTGAIIPDSLVKKMNEATKFNQGFYTVEYMAAAYLDMHWHTITKPVEEEVSNFENGIITHIELMDEIIPRYKSTYFQHIFSGGYSAGYYSYLWSEVLDSDAFAAFTETGDIFNQEVAKKYRVLLSKGGSVDGMKLYQDFRGRKPTIDALLKRKGF